MELDLRKNYGIIPLDYYLELTQKGSRYAKKADAFLVYAARIEAGITEDSERFYAKRWSVSPSTAHEWIKEFDREMELWADHWHLKRKQYNSSIKNQAEQIEQTSPSKSSTIEAHETVVCLDTTEQTEQSKTSEDFKLNNNNKRDANREFDGLFQIYGWNYKFPGKKSEAKEEYMKVYLEASYREFELAIITYLHDEKHDFNDQAKLYNAKNFFKEGAYVPYLPRHISINVEGQWLIGTYSAEKDLFTTTESQPMRLTKEVFIAKYSKGDIKYIREVS